jgi:hypothetical protein
VRWVSSEPAVISAKKPAKSARSSEGSTMRALLVLVILWASSARTFAGYDDTWFQSNFWPGEYPPGFSVTKKRTTLMARSGMDKDLPRDVACEMPYLALIHPWNKERIRKSNLQFFSATKIIKMIAKEDFDFGDDITVKKGEVVEYIANRAKGFFTCALAANHMMQTNSSKMIGCC